MNTLLNALLLSIQLLILSKTYAITSSQVPIPTPIEAPVSVLPSPLTPSSVRAYVAQQAQNAGVNPITAVCLINHESQDGFQEGFYDPALQGYEKNGSVSFGIWQFNNRNQGFDEKVADSLVSSTALAMQWILAGEISKWGTWNEYCSSTKIFVE